ncbi:MAG: hypothetical protein HUU25_14375, partial [Candidatus Sumerlaeia bacterium]|nr:hypothetical protein [Candidatus Sumerlaeia bacterium]
GDEAFPFEVATGPLHVRLGADLSRPESVQVIAGATALRLGVVGLAMQDTATGQMRVLETPRDVEPAVEGNRVIYRGALPGGDIEYVYHRHGFEQNLILHAPQSLPAPESLGMDPATTLVGLVSRLDGEPEGGTLELRSLAPAGNAVDALTAARDGLRVISADVQIQVSDSQQEPVLTFSAGTAWAGDKGGLTGTRRISQVLGMAGDAAALLDGVPVRWVRELEGPVTVDYIVSAALTARNHLLERGQTYFISSQLTVENGETVVCEPGAVIKINGGLGSTTPGVLVASGGTFEIDGQPLDPVAITYAGNGSVGQSVAGASGYNANRYGRGITWSAGSSGFVRHLRMDGGVEGIWLHGDLAWGGSDGFSHSIFRDFTDFPILAEDVEGELAFFNCVIGDRYPGWQSGTPGIWMTVADIPSSLDLSVVNCTFSDHQPVEVIYDGPTPGGGQSWPSLALDVRNNYFTSPGPTEVGQAIEIGWSQFVESGTVSHNATHYIVAVGWEESSGLTTGSDRNLNESNVPSAFAASAAGDFYPSSGALSDLLDMGDGAPGRLSGLSIEAPEPIESDVTSNTAWAPMAADGDGSDTEIDIGFHYPRVDYVVEGGTQTVQAEVTIEPGTRIAFEADASACLAVGEDGALIAQGGFLEPPVEFFSAIASGDRADVPAAGDHLGLRVLRTAPRTSNLHRLRVRHAASALVVEGGRLFNPIANGEFIDCFSGVVFDGAEGGDLMNCLLLRCDDGCKIVLPDGEFSDHAVEGNTFALCGNGLLIDQAEEGDPDTPFSLVLEDNLFLGSTQAAFHVSEFVATASADFRAVDRNNAWYLNSWNVQDDPSMVENDQVAPNSAGRHHLRDNPRVAHFSAERAGDAFAGRRWDSQGLYPFSDGLFLAQVEDDVSRFPFVLPPGVGLAEDGLAFTGTFPEGGIATITVGLTGPSLVPASASTNLGVISGSGVTEGTQSGDGLGRLWIWVRRFAGEEDDWAVSGTLTLAFTSGDELAVHLPPLTMAGTGGEELWCGWVALDGSVFHGHSSGGLMSRGSESFDQDSGYALAVDTAGLARSAWEAVASPSPLVDAGSRDFWN